MADQGDDVKASRIVNVASVPHRSPFRYPGGKTWLVPHMRRWLNSRASPPAEFAEVFAGGAIVGLSALFDGLTQRLTLVELDQAVAAVWQAILGGDGQALADRITSFQVTPEAVREVLAASYERPLDRAFATILRNRMQRGGILAAGASLIKRGENGRGLLSRWYPETLKRRILDIAERRESIRFLQSDGVQFLRDHADRGDMAFFIDPPYTVAGRRLYRHSEVDHEALFDVAASLRGDFLMTYDNAEPIRRLAARHGLDTHEVAMKNTHHAVLSELLIGRELSWARKSEGGAGAR